MDVFESEVVGALVGAFVGGIAGVLASRWSIRYDRKIAACSALQALADEARFNAIVVRHLQEDLWDFTPSALERQAFDDALPVLHFLPSALRDRSRDVRAKILIMMHIEEVLEAAQSNPGDAPAAMVQKRQGLIETLPRELDRIADDVEAYVKSDCMSRWSI